MLIDECALTSLNWSTTGYIPSSYQMLSMFPHDRRRENQESVYHSKLLEIANCEFKGIAEPSCKEVNHGKSLFGSEIRSLASKLNTSAHHVLPIHRDSAFKSASLPDPQKPSGLPHSRQKRPRMRIHRVPNAKHCSHPS